MSEKQSYGLRDIQIATIEANGDNVPKVQAFPTFEVEVVVHKSGKEAFLDNPQEFVKRQLEDFARRQEYDTQDFQERVMELHQDYQRRMADLQEDRAQSIAQWKEWAEKFSVDVEIPE